MGATGAVIGYLAGAAFVVVGLIWVFRDTIGADIARMLRWW